MVICESRQKRNVRLIVLACIAVILWQVTFYISSAQLDKKYRIRATAGLISEGLFVDYYYYLNLFPVYAYGHHINSKAEAERIVREDPRSLRMEKGFSIRAGDLGKIWLYLPEAFIRGDTRGLKTFRFNACFFTLALLGLLTAMWYVGQFPLGILLVVLIGSHPFQLYEVYADSGYGTGQVFAVNISTTLAVMALSIPLIFCRKLNKFYLWGHPIVSGIFLATIRQVRTEPVVIIFSVLACYIFASQIKKPVRAALILLLLVSFLIGSKGWEAYFDHKINQAYEFVKKAGGHPFKEGRLHYHLLWHELWCGLGDFDRKYGYKFNDIMAYRYASPILKSEGKLDFEMISAGSSTVTYDVDGLYCKYIWSMPEYDKILRDKIIGDIRKDPKWYLNILAKRLYKIINRAAPVQVALKSWRVTLPISGILLIPMLALLAFLRKWPLFKLLCFSLPLAITALVVYADYGTEYYSIFPQVIAAICSAAIWIWLRRAAQ